MTRGGPHEEHSCCNAFRARHRDFGFAQGKTDYAAIHVDKNDPARMNMALSNAQKINNCSEVQGDEVVIELVAYGPGLMMLIPGKSLVEQRITSLSLELPCLSFAACGKTNKKMSEKAGKDMALMEERQEKAFRVLPGDPDVSVPTPASLGERVVQRCIGKEHVDVLQRSYPGRGRALELRSVGNEKSPPGAPEDALADANFLHVEIEDVPLPVEG